MALKRESYPDIPDDVWANLSSDVDRERTSASQTASANALKKAKEDAEALVAQQVQEQLDAMKLSEQEKLEKERAILADKEKEVAKKERAISIREKLGSESVPVSDSIINMLASVDDGSIDNTVSEFIDIYKSSVSSEVDKVKQELQANLDPGKTDPNAGVVDKEALKKEAFARGDVAGAIDIMIQSD